MNFFGEFLDLWFQDTWRTHDFDHTEIILFLRLLSLMLPEKFQANYQKIMPKAAKIVLQNSVALLMS